MAEEVGHCMNVSACHFTVQISGLVLLTSLVTHEGYLCLHASGIM